MRLGNIQPIGVNLNTSNLEAFKPSKDHEKVYNYPSTCPKQAHFAYL